MLAAEYLDRSKSGRLSVTTSDTFAVTEEFVHLTFKTYKVRCIHHREPVNETRCPGDNAGFRYFRCVMYRPAQDSASKSVQLSQRQGEWSGL
jgi:hypothetical protein